MPTQSAVLGVHLGEAFHYSKPCPSAWQQFQDLYHNEPLLLPITDIDSQPRSMLGTVPPDYQKHFIVGALEATSAMLLALIATTIWMPHGEGLNADLNAMLRLSVKLLATQVRQAIQ